MQKTITSREFNQDTGKAKRAAELGPVYITNRGKPEHVLLSFDAYQRLTGRARSIAEMLALPEAAAVELDLPERDDLARAAVLDD